MHIERKYLFLLPDVLKIYGSLNFILLLIVTRGKLLIALNVRACVQGDDAVISVSISTRPWVS